MQKIVLIFSLFLLTACAGQQQDTNQLANQLSLQSPQQILSLLQTTEPPERDYAQYHLNIGLLQMLSGDFPASIETLTLAKKEMAVLAAMSISENAAAGTINETLRSYSGYPTDRVMVHNILALSYLFNDDISGARVEVLQADIAMKKLAGKNSLSGQLASAHMISAVIYEMLNEQSSALISYRNAENILEERNITIPVSLKQALLRMSYAVDRKGQYLTYQKRYNDFPIPIKNTKSKVFVLYFDGVVSNKKQTSLMVPSGNGEQLIRISMPTYPYANYRGTRANLSDANHQVSSELIENIEQLARDDLGKEYPSILLLTTTRALAKYEVVDKANEKDSLLGALINIATLLTEIADLRSWNMLPSNIQFAYLETADSVLNVNSGNKIQQQIPLNQGTKNVLLITSLNTPIFHFQQ